MAELEGPTAATPLRTTYLPFDDINDFSGETVIFPSRRISDGGEAIADVADGMCLEGVVPVQLVITNYRLKFYEPTKEGATLAVTVCGATDLKAADLNGYSDPYAVVSLTNCNHRSFRHPKKTEIMEKTLNPTWNETFSFAGVEPEACLRVELFDWDKRSQDDPLGEVIVPDVALWEGGETKMWNLCLPIMESGKVGQGTVQLRLRRVWLSHDVDVRHTSIPLVSIEAVKFHEKDNMLEIHTKAPRLLRVFFDDADTARQVERALHTYPDSVESFFCNAGEELPEREYIFSWTDLLDRLTAEDGPSVRGQRGEDAAAYRARWRVDGEVNAGYCMCETYPDKVLLPFALPKDALEVSAKFRTKHRFPCVAWLHPSNGAMLVRCSQPHTGLSGAGKTSGKAKGDWDCLHHFAVPGYDGRLTICDCRPFLNAQANRMKGGGTEYDMGVKGFHMQFLDIGNIHDMRNSIAHLRQGVCQQADFKMSYSSIGEWHAHLHGVIQGAAYVADVIESGETVVVHCSDGWDRTSQIVSLASLLLDGHYRTIAGFPELIEKDWLRLGHKFADRNGFKSRPDQEKTHEDSSPIFLQFIECIAQIWHVFPHFFEYTIEFLAFVLYHSLSARFGNFLGKCEKQRSDTCPCLWSAFKAEAHKWRNPLYDPSASRVPLSPCCVPMQQMRFQHELYARQCQMWPKESTLSPSQRSAPTGSMPGGPPPGAGAPLQKEASVYRKSFGMPSRSMGPQSMRACEEPGRAALKHFVEPPKEGDPSAALSEELQAVENFLRRFLALPELLPGEPRVEITQHTAHVDHAEYVIKTYAGPSSYEVTRRFSQFSELKQALLAYPQMKVDVPFPHRTIFTASQKVIEARVDGLGAWLEAVVTALVSEEKAFFLI